MLIDARRLSQGELIETDICIVGAGPAGIAIAHEFRNLDLRVSLLEAGDIGENKDVQQLSIPQNNSLGDPYPCSYWTRHREFGGTAKCWGISLGKGHLGARYVPLDPIDLAQRDEVPYSGWPISMNDLNPFYERAQSICKLGPFSYDASSWADQDAPSLTDAADRVATKIFQCGSRDVFLDDYRELLAQSRVLTVYLNAIAVELETDDLARQVKLVRANTLEGNQFNVSAKWFILAAGGIETTRLLLLSNRVQLAGLGNSHDLLGRFLMDHQMIRSGLLKPFSRASFDRMALYDLRSVRGTHVIGKFILKEDFLRRHKLLNTATALFPRSGIYSLNPMRILLPRGMSYRSKASHSLDYIRQSIRQRTWPARLGHHLLNVARQPDDLLYQQWRLRQPFSLPTGQYNFSQGGWSALQSKRRRFSLFEVFHLAEQVPDPSNRILLGTARDALGCRRVNVCWRWQERDIQSMLLTQDLLVKEFARMGLGQLKLERDKGFPQLIFPGIHHPMGTTRMSLNSRDGIVNADCRLHGVANLFIASSSVFPTGGYANPTLTIVALALRIADYLKACIAR